MSAEICEYCGKNFEKCGISLPCCGYIVCLEHLETNSNNIKCYFCPNKEIIVQECLNMAKNKKNLDNYLAKEKKQKLEKVIEEFRTIQNDPSYFVQESFKDLQIQMDLRREEFKLELARKVDEISNKLAEKLKSDQEIYIQKLKDILEQTNIQDLEKSRYFDLIEKFKSLSKKYEFTFKNDLENIEILFGSLIIYKNCSKVRKTLQGHSDWVNDLSVLSSGDIISCSGDRTIKIWDKCSGEVLRTLEGHVGYVNCIDTSENCLVSGSANGEIKIWNLETGFCEHSALVHSQAVNSVKFLENSRKIASASSDKSIKILDKETYIFQRALYSNESIVLCLEELSENRLAAGYIGFIKIWCYNSGECLKQIKANEDWLNDMRFNRVTGELIGCSGDRTIKVWNLDLEKCVKIMSGHEGYVNCLDLTETGEILSGSESGEIKIWSLSTGDCLGTLKQNNSPIKSIKSLGMGEFMTGSTDFVIRIWS